MQEQVEAILDKYTVGKVAFTMAGYHAIVPNLTTEEEATIRGFLKQAREEAVDYKNMNEISAIFKIYKTKSEQYLISRGARWRSCTKHTPMLPRPRKPRSKPKPQTGISSRSLPSRGNYDALPASAFSVFS